MYHALGILFICMETAWSRESSKGFRSMPAISNSLVNLGKMDISFHFNTKIPDGPAGNLRSEHYMQTANPFFIQKSDLNDLEPCPCSTLKNYKNPFLSSPSDMLNKILKSNDLFSFNQEPLISSMCCDSHEHLQEDTVFFEFNPKSHPDSATLVNGMTNSAPSFPIMIDNILQPKGPMPLNSKAKAIEIFFFPKKKEANPFEFTKSQPKKKEVKKSEIQAVGDKELRNDFKNIRYRPSFPMNASFKTKEEDNEVEKEKEDKKPEEKIEEKIEEKQEEVEGTTKIDTTTQPSLNSV